jgi:hypothetical protein
MSIHHMLLYRALEPDTPYSQTIKLIESFCCRRLNTRSVFADFLPTDLHVFMAKFRRMGQSDRNAVPHSEADSTA